MRQTRFRMFSASLSGAGPPEVVIGKADCFENKIYNREHPDPFVRHRARWGNEPANTFVSLG